MYEYGHQPPISKIIQTSEVKTNSKTMFSYGPLHTGGSKCWATNKNYNSSVRTQDVVMKTSRK